MSVAAPIVPRRRRFSPEQATIRRLLDRAERPIRSILLRAAGTARARVNLDFLENLLAGRMVAVTDLATVLEVPTMIGILRVDLQPLLERTIFRAAAAGAEVFAETNGFTAPEPEVFRAFARDAARTEVGQLVTAISEGQLGAIQEVTARGFAEGLSPRQQAEQLRGIIGLDERRAGALAKFQTELAGKEGLSEAQRQALLRREEQRLLQSRSLMVARTESVRAGTLAQDRIWSEAVERGELNEELYEEEWVASPNACEVCSGLDGERAPIGGQFPDPGGSGPPDPHPGCLPPGVLAQPVGHLEAATERPYDGLVVILRTTLGDELACTPNHPVLTPAGWKAAQLVNVGEHVVCRRRGEGGRLLQMQDEHAPAPIEKIAEALRRSPQVSAREVKVAAEDFHGDVSREGEIAVVWTDRSLLADHLPPSPEQVGQLVFLGGRPELPRLAGKGLSAYLFLRAFAAAGRVVRCLGQLAPLLWRHPRLPDALLLATATHLHPMLAQGALNGAALDAVQAGELEHRIAGRVALDQIVSRELRPYRGHVFNLQTSAGAFFAGGILTHNCMCGRRLVRREE